MGPAIANVAERSPLVINVSSPLGSLWAVWLVYIETTANGPARVAMSRIDNSVDIV
ncbi:hypothetical protein COLO4_14347 [Corchorus olitorius]|uniref:Uncharacterized protein n=1 Tax=Corchorus olitorius TaxID=93759 RepID=A0A1R3JSJ3_9ROSI|nr:hypothetical protein COLO4_14347 [Corchorus olitorius]